LVFECIKSDEENQVTTASTGEKREKNLERVRKRVKERKRERGREGVCVSVTGYAL
jgi:hypothetical protein